MAKPGQLTGLPVPALLPPPPEGPQGPPDSRSWRVPSTLEPMPHRGALHDGALVAVRWTDGWRIAKRWRRERGGILCTLEDGGTIWVDSANGIMMLHRDETEKR